MIDNINDTNATLNNDLLKKSPSENDQQYLWRLDGLIRSGMYQNWNEITPRVNVELFGDDEDNYKGESAYRKEVASARKFFEAGVFATTTNDTVKQLRDERDKLYAAKRELADQRREYNKLVVHDARTNNLVERLVEAAEKMNTTLPLLQTPTITCTSDKEAVMLFSDWHFGMTTDNIWNQYNVDICKQRVYEFISKAIEYLNVFSINKLHVVSLGDLFHGSIHVTCRVASEENTCEQIIHVSELVAESLEELSKYVNEVHFYSCYGNHGRTMQNKSEQIHDDNMERIIPWWLNARLQNNQKIAVHTSEYKEFTVVDVLGHTVCCLHGDLDNIKSVAPVINTVFTKKFGKQVDYIISGDKHHLEEFEDTGIETVIVRSLCGTDEYANNKRLYSRPGQTLMVFNKDEGRECTRNIKLH